MSKKVKKTLLKELNNNGIQAQTHYLSLPESPYINNLNLGLIHAKRWEEQIIRLPIYYKITKKELDYVISTIKYSSVVDITL